MFKRAKVLSARFASTTEPWVLPKSSAYTSLSYHLGGGSMWFAWDVTITAGTEEGSPKTVVLKLSKGVITHAGIFFPPGCHGLVKSRLLFHEFQLIPLSKGEWATGNDAEVGGERFYKMGSAPYELKLVACSPSCIYDHTITIRIEVNPEAVASYIPMIEQLKKLINLIKGVEE